MLRTQDFIAPVGGGLTVQIKANYIKYLDGTAGGLSTRIRVRSDRGGADLTMEPGDSVKLPQEVAQFTVENADGEAPIRGVLIAGMGEFASDRVIGTVSVIDAARDRTMAGISFMALVFQAEDAGKYSVVQVWNPVGNIRRAVVRAFSVGMGGQGAFGVRIMNTPLANAASPAQGNSPHPINKYGGRGVSSMESRVETMVAIPAGDQIYGGRLGAEQTSEWIKLVEPIIIDPGYGLAVVCTALNTRINMNMDFVEELL